MQVGGKKKKKEREDGGLLVCVKGGEGSTASVC